VGKMKVKNDLRNGQSCLRSLNPGFISRWYSYFNAVKNAQSGQERRVSDHQLAEYNCLLPLPKIKQDWIKQ